MKHQTQLEPCPQVESVTWWNIKPNKNPVLKWSHSLDETSNPIRILSSSGVSHVIKHQTQLESSPQVESVTWSNIKPIRILSSRDISHMMFNQPLRILSPMYCKSGHMTCRAVALDFKKSQSYYEQRIKKSQLISHMHCTRKQNRTLKMEKWSTTNTDNQQTAPDNPTTRRPETNYNHWQPTISSHH
jgi:hypothetical protein